MLITLPTAYEEADVGIPALFIKFLTATVATVFCAFS